MTIEELLEQIRALPFSVAAEQHGADADHVEDDVAAAVIEVGVAADLARVAQDSLKTRVDLARGRGISWSEIGRAMELKPWRARRRRWETHPLDSWW